MTAIHLLFAWWWFVAGLVSGAVQGLFFHREDWMGGYGSWRRRMTRLGHIAFFGTGLLNATFSLSLAGGPTTGAWEQIASASLLAGAVAMPTVCYLSAWRKPMRHLFFIPVTLLLAGTLATAITLSR